jgi:GNAT superfamily N-acetyltransferase
MRVIDLDEEHAGLFCHCLEDWSEEAREGAPRRTLWYRKMREQGLRAKLALDDDGEVGGMIQYVPAEVSFIDGGDLHFILCIWVHGHKEGRGNFQGRGMGKALLHAAEEDARALGARGMAAWGVVLPFWMRARWFKRYGYRRVDRNGIAALMWKPFVEGARPPRWIPERKRPGAVSGQVTVVSLLNGWCVAMNLVHERARRAAAEFGERVVFQEIDTSDREAFSEWGIADGLYIDGKQVRTGPPPSYEKIRKLIEKRVRRLV